MMLPFGLLPGPIFTDHRRVIGVDMGKIPPTELHRVLTASNTLISLRDSVDTPTPFLSIPSTSEITHRSSGG